MRPEQKRKSHLTRYGADRTLMQSAGRFRSLDLFHWSRRFGRMRRWKIFFDRSRFRSRPFHVDQILDLLGDLGRHCFHQLLGSYWGRLVGRVRFSVRFAWPVHLQIVMATGRRNVSWDPPGEKMTETSSSSLDVSTPMTSPRVPSSIRAASFTPRPSPFFGPLVHLRGKRKLGGRSETWMA